MRKKNLKHDKRTGCNFYNSECWMNVCGIYPYKKKKLANEKEEVHDTG